jgi:hypothetical protein
VLWQNLKNDEATGTPINNYGRSSTPDSWIKQAPRNLERTRTKLEIRDADFRNEDKEWEPIPLDMAEPSLRTAIDSIDTTISRVSDSNGYAATMPEERAFVLDGLISFSSRLKQAASISRPYLRIGFERLSMVIRRFGGTALEIVATAAKEALKEWLKKKGIGFLDYP